MDDTWEKIDPERYTEAILKLNVQGLQVEELYSFEALEETRQVHALILLYKWAPIQQSVSSTEYYDPQIFFCRQSLNRATVPQALLAALLNSTKVDLGETLTTLKDQLQSLDPLSKTQALANSQALQLMVQHCGPSSGHYSVYIPHQTHIFELCGLNRGPVCVGECQDEDWTDRIKQHLGKRVAEFSEFQIQFSLLALTANRKESAFSRLSSLQSQVNSLQQRISLEQNIELQSELQTELDRNELQAKEQAQVVQEEEERARKWPQENARRKHNYVPFVLRMLEKLEANGLFPAVIKAANRRAEKQPEQES